jgi:MFS family permease
MENEGLDPDRLGAGNHQRGLARVFSSQTFESLQVRDFRWLWLSSMGAFIAMQMQMVARGWLVYELTSSTMALAWVMVSLALPMSVSSLIGGAITDRVSKRNLLGASLAASAAVTAWIALLIHLDVISFWHLLLAGFLNGIVLSFQMPGRFSFIPQIVGDNRLVNANALLNAGMNLSRVMSPALAGVLIGVMGTAIVFDIMALSYILGAGSVFMMHNRGEPTGRSGQSVTYDVKEGLRYVRRNTVVLALLVMAFLPLLFGFPFMMLMPVFAVDALGLGSGGLGVLFAISGLGAIVGSLVVAYLGNFKHLGILFFLAAITWGVALALFSQTTSLMMAALPLGLIGLASAIFMSINLSMIQMYAAPEMRGRVMSIFMWTFSMMPLGLIPLSITAEMAGTPLAFLGSAILLAVCATLLFLLIPPLRHLRPVIGEWTSPAQTENADQIAGQP